MDGAVPEQEALAMGMYMACVAWGGAIGFACYDANRNSAAVFQAPDDLAASTVDCTQSVQLVKLHVSPDLIWTSAGSSDALVEALKSPSVDRAEYVVKRERPGIFGRKEVHAKLISLECQGMPPGLVDARQRWAYLRTLIDTDADQQLAALGGLISILERENALETENGVPVLARLSQLTPEGFLVVDPQTLHSLQIFQSEPPPSLMGIGVAKEGFSVFGWLNTTVTPVGARCLRSWMVRPLDSVARIERRLDLVEALAHAREALRPKLKGCKDVVAILRRLERSMGVYENKDFFVLAKAVSSILEVKHALLHIASETLADRSGRTPAASPAAPSPFSPPASRPRNTPAALSQGSPEWDWDVLDETSSAPSLLEELVDALSSDALAQTHALLHTILSEEYTDGDDSVIADGVCDELDGLKGSYGMLGDVMTRVAEAEVRRVPETLAARRCAGQVWTCEYCPGTGYLMRVRGPIPGQDVLDYLPDWQFVMQGPEEGGKPSTFYYTAACAELDAEFGDVLNNIRDVERAVLSELVTRLSTESRPALEASAAAVGAVDAALALASAAQAHNLVRPEVVEDPVLKITNGRHLLSQIAVEQRGDPFVANDCHMDHAAGRVQVVTGPNQSGKSVHVRGCAIIAYLAHVGSFVPADAAVVGLADRIAAQTPARVGMNAKIGSSWFLTDLTRVGSILRAATPRSIVVLDEFGKGTLAGDGAALLAGCIQYLARGVVPAPRAFVVTHFQELLSQDVLPRTPSMEFLTMAYRVEQDRGGASGAGGDVSGSYLPAEVKYLFKLVPGHLAPSYGIHCARVHGIPEKIVQRAAQIAACLESGAPVPPPQHKSRVLELREQSMREAKQIARTFDRERDDPEVVRQRLIDCLTIQYDSDADEDQDSPPTLVPQPLPAAANEAGPTSDHATLRPVEQTASHGGESAPRDGGAPHTPNAIAAGDGDGPTHKRAKTGAAASSGTARDLGPVLDFL
ncbi:unnamed protein product [Pedinophyceae sp. YPF-701]|nr:unnamed protein product [Pedinophyceae sp. YPF-701]